jgi:hypothetical protein
MGGWRALGFVCVVLGLCACGPVVPDAQEVGATTATETDAGSAPRFSVGPPAAIDAGDGGHAAPQGQSGAGGASGDPGDDAAGGHGEADASTGQDVDASADDAGTDAGEPPECGACDDGDACTVDSCDALSSACSHSARVCDDHQSCTDDACNPATGCTFTPNTATCDDGSACTRADHCAAGQCVGTAVACDDGQPCTTDACNPAASGDPCTHEPNTLACDDGNSCTAGDRCSGGSCRSGNDPACGEGQLECREGTPNSCTCADGYTAQAGFCVPPGPPIPAPSGPCPTLATGTVQVLGHDVQLWVGARRSDVKGAVYFYWHGTGSTADEARYGLLGALDEIVAEGGVVASFISTAGSGSNTGNGVWYTGDFELADQILACAVQQLNIDTRRVYTGGCSAGGLQAGVMAYERASYLAGVAPNSGGVLRARSPQHGDHLPSIITAHGAMGTDVVGIDFATASLRLDMDMADQGALVIDCDHGGSHCAAPPELITAQWQFLKDHPWGVAPDPYGAGLPDSFPDYCRAIQ